jgi:hypothetical protein
VWIFLTTSLAWLLTQVRNPAPRFDLGHSCQVGFARSLSHSKQRRTSIGVLLCFEWYKDWTKANREELPRANPFHGINYPTKSSDIESPDVKTPSGSS